MASRSRSAFSPPGSLAVVLVDRSHRVLFTNRGAVDLFGLQGNGARPEPCHRLLRLRTRDGRPLCRADCRPWRDARAGRPGVIHGARPGRAFAPGRLTVTSCPMTRPHDGDLALLHVIAPAASEARRPRATRRPPPARGLARGSRRHAGLDRLSRRQRDVLGLLAAGVGTAEVARGLSISPITVRHHVQSILVTLRVHRRLDAVLAWIEGLQSG